MRVSHAPRTFKSTYDRRKRAARLVWERVREKKPQNKTAKASGAGLFLESGGKKSPSLTAARGYMGARGARGGSGNAGGIIHTDATFPSSASPRAEGVPNSTEN